MTEFDLTNQFARARLDMTIAARAAAWRRIIDAHWAGDQCGHADRDLLHTCRACGERVVEAASVQ